MNDQVRRATASDIETLCALNREVQAVHASLYPQDFKPEADGQAVADFFLGMIGADNHVIAIHEGRDGASAYLWLEVQQRPETLFTFAMTRTYIHHISVREDARRQGAASALIAWAEAYSREAGIEEMLVDHWSENFAAAGFFSILGFAPLREVRRKRLSG